MVQIRVIGAGHATSAPDEAGFTFQCHGHGANAQEALAQATAFAAAVLQELDALGVPEERRGVQRTHVHPRTRWVDDREVREGWDAHATVECSVHDATMAFGLLEQTATLDGVSIAGPQWRIRPDNAAHHAARKEAVDHARGKAASFAAAAGLELGELHELIEGGASDRPQMRSAMAMAESAPLEAADQVVHASVTLVFDAR